MGFRLEIYNNNFVGLIADFLGTVNTAQYCTSNNLDEVIAYFNLYLDEETKRLKKRDPNQHIVEKLAINADNVDTFQAQLKTLAMNLTDAEALNCQLLFEEWDSSKSYIVNDRIRHKGVLYKCLQDHVAQEDWYPEVTPSLWAQILINPTVSGPQPWTQPDSTNGYKDGDQVIHNGITYESQVDNNVWEPGIAGTESLWIVI